jgi:hypothetical protein
MKVRAVFAAVVAVVGLSACCLAQQAAPTGDKTATWMIDMERRWAEASCTGERITAELLADDFIGTAPDGSRYTKADTLKESANAKGSTDCKLIDAKVYYFGDSIAVVQGSETAVGPAEGGQKRRHLIWNDTWMKRKGKWQIITVQDMNAPER